MYLNDLPETGFVRLPQILSIFPVGKSTWWAGVRSGKYPASVKLSARITAWHVEEIRSLIASSEAQSSNPINIMKVKNHEN